MYCIAYIDSASGRRIRRIPVVYANAEEASRYARMLNCRDLRLAGRHYVVEPLPGSGAPLDADPELGSAVQPPAGVTGSGATPFAPKNF